MATDTAPVTGSPFPSTDGTLERRRLGVFLGVVPWFVVAVALFVRTDWLSPVERGGTETDGAAESVAAD